MNRSISMMGLACILAGVGCAYTPPAKSSGPARSADGVSVAVVGQRCVEERDDENGPIGTWVSLRLEAVNHSTNPVDLHPRNIQIVSPPGYQAGFDEDTITLKPGERRLVTQRYTNDVSAECSATVQLNLANAVAQAGKPMSLPQITFLE